MFRKQLRPTRGPGCSLALLEMFGNILPSSSPWRHDSRRRIAKVSKP